MGENFGSLDNFGRIHFDVLKEIGSIGSGNAVTALSKLLNKKITMSVPVVNMVEFKDIATFIGGADQLVVSVLVGISGDVNGIMMFLVQHKNARTLLNIVMNRFAPDTEEFSEMDQSAFQEIANILTSSYLGSLSGLTNKAIKPSVPFLAIDMANAILSVPAIEFGKVSDKALLIETVFQAVDNTAVSGFFLLVPDMPSFKVIMSSLGVA